MVQIGGTNMEDVKSLVRHAEGSKVSSIFCLADMFFRPSDVDDLIHYLKIVSAEAPHTPLIYYHIPSFTDIKVNLKELLSRSSEIPTFGDQIHIQRFSYGKFVGVGQPLTTCCVLGSNNLFLSALFQCFDSAVGTIIDMFPITTATFSDILTRKNSRKLQLSKKSSSQYQTNN